MTFTPEDGYTGTATPVPYVVTAPGGVVSTSALITITVVGATDDAETTPVNTQVTVDVLAKKKDVSRKRQ